MATQVSSISLTYTVLGNGQIQLLDEQGAGEYYGTVQDIKNRYLPTAAGDIVRELLKRIIVAKVVVDGLQPSAINGKTITLTLSTGSNPTISVA
jgi:hypothetical protein